MIENTSNKIYVQKMGIEELKEVSFYLEYDPLYIANDVNVFIYNNSYGSIKFRFRGENYYFDTYKTELYQDDDKLIDYVIKKIIAYENARLEEIKKDK